MHRNFANFNQSEAMATVDVHGYGVFMPQWECICTNAVMFPSGFIHDIGVGSSLLLPIGGQCEGLYAWDE